MSEPEENNLIEERTEVSPRRRRVHPALIAGIVSGIGVLFLLLWYFLASSGDAGRPVPAPRSRVDQAPADVPVSETITLTQEQIQNAGITIEQVGEQLSTEAAEVSSTGNVEANQYRQTPAVTLVGGVVRRVVPELGANVSVGQTVVILFSDEFAQAQSRYIALQTEAANARRNYERSQRLVTVNAPGRSELEEAAKLRKAAEASLSEMRNRYERTTKLLRIGAASREELEQDNTKLRTAEAELEQARLRETRAAELLPLSNEVRTASEEALNKLRTAEGELSAARQRLILFGMSPDRVNMLRSNAQVTSELSVPAPLSGTVTSRSVNVGEVVDASKELIRVTDLSSVWVIAQVYERDIGRLRVGSDATVSSDAFPEKIFRGTISYIDPQLDEATRTGRVRIEVANPARELKLGMYVRVALRPPGNLERIVPIIPADAVQNIGGRQIVFVATADPNVFELRTVRLTTKGVDRYQVDDGLNVGEKVVGKGSFAIRAEYLKSRQSDQHAH